MSAFPCNRCGACCRLVGAVGSLAHLDRGDGACRHLIPHADGTTSCEVYETRPKECRVDESVPAVMQLAEWHRRNADACAVLRLHVYGGA